ncbi:MAG: hypothetical protein CMC52_04975 [Flavobacteriaceae bacterium]|jgi:hypothetical membrane protein|nr:hypothetical protein [Flavobacteriaceae bacterium]|tara:strand:+ start:4117 stop:4791 length:675 start_codon:yes stop_codon:yes gene_type:complete
MKSILSINFIRFIPIVFSIGILISIFFYPGGNIHDNSQIGYSFTHNFLSDLGGYQSHSGEVNFISSFFFAFSLFLFGFAGIAFLFIPQIFKEDKINYFLALVGSAFFMLGSFFFAGVGLTPHDLFMDEHIFFALNAFRFLIPASFLYLIVLYRSHADKFFSLVLFFLLVSTFAYVIYQLSGGNPMEDMNEMIKQATIQKLIVMVNIFCVFFISFAFSQQLKRSN